MRRRIGVPWPASTPQSSFAVSAWASKWTMPMLPGPADLGDGGRGRPGDRVVAAEDDRDRAGRRHLADLAVDERVGAIDPRRDDVGVAGVDDGQDLERLDAELERVDRAGRVLRLADRARPEPGARAVAHGVVEGRADDRDVDAARPELRRVGDPGQLHERREADVGRQVEVVVRLVRAVPAVARREVDVTRGLGTIGHDGPPEAAPPFGNRASGPHAASVGAPPVRVRRPAGRAPASYPVSRRCWSP